MKLYTVVVYKWSIKGDNSSEIISSAGQGLSFVALLIGLVLYFTGSTQSADIRRSENTDGLVPRERHRTHTCHVET